MYTCRSCRQDITFKSQESTLRYNWRYQQWQHSDAPKTNEHSQQPYYFCAPPPQHLCHTMPNHKTVSFDLVVLLQSGFGGIHWPSIESRGKELKRVKTLKQLAITRPIRTPCLSGEANQVHWSRTVWSHFSSNAPPVQHILLPLWWLGETTFQTAPIGCHRQLCTAFGQVALWNASFHFSPDVMKYGDNRAMQCII